MKSLKTPVKDMVVAAKARIEEMTAKQALDLLNDDNVLIVDIRDIRERHKLGYIPGSYHAPRGMLEFWVDPQSPYFKDIFDSNKRFIFHCASGWRSALSVATLNDMGFEAAHISDGFSGWVEAGGPVEHSQPKSSGTV